MEIQDIAARRLKPMCAAFRIGRRRRLAIRSSDRTGVRREAARGFRNLLSPVITPVERAACKSRRFDKTLPTRCAAGMLPALAFTCGLANSLRVTANPERKSVRACDETQAQKYCH